MKLVRRILWVACVAVFSLTKAGAEERPNQLLTSLSGTTISGYVDTSAHWTATSESLPEGALSFPVVFITGPRIVREQSNPVTGAVRGFHFTVHRLGQTNNEITVYVNFQSPGGDRVQGGITIPAGARKATTSWFVANDFIHEGPRVFTASISMAPVRLRMPGARYQISPRWPHSSTVVIIDP